MMISLARTVLLALACAMVSTVSAEPTLNNIDLGSYVTGPQINVADLRGRVVVVEYWGITCGPCLAAIPHTTELAERYGHEKLVIIANQVWGASDRQCKETWEARAKSNFVAVINGGSVRDFQPRSVPTAVMFDHEGKFIWQGHPGSMDRALADAVAKVPARAAAASAESEPALEPIVSGIELKYFGDEVQDINEQGRSFGRAVTTLTRRAEREDDRAVEAKAILEQVDRWVAEQTQAMEGARTSDPATAYAIAERVGGMLAGDTRAAAFTSLTKEFEQDDELMVQVRSTLMLRGIKAEAEAIGLSADPQAAQGKRELSRQLGSIERGLRRLVSVWPESEAGKEAATLLTAWGFE